MIFRQSTLLAATLACLGWAQFATAAEPDRNAIALETFSRLQPAEVEASPQLKSALQTVLSRQTGKPEFVQLVKRFKVSGQESGLIAVAARMAQDEAGVDAARLLLDSPDRTKLTSLFAGNDTNAIRGVTVALGGTSDKRAVPLVLPLVVDPKRDSTLRKEAVRALSRTHEGAIELINLTKKDALPADARFTASMVLNTARWEDIKDQAAKLLPLPQSRNAQHLPPVSELLKVRSNPAKGEQVFFREESQCSKCHKVGDKGADFGPALTEIGTKLGKDALYEAILDPSAGISFDYEGWELMTRNGGEFSGIIASETADELTLKVQQSAPVRLRKSDVTRRQKLKLSIMPAGLQQTMSMQDLTDLVEYLSALRKR